jgi:hypothetical protein
MLNKLFNRIKTMNALKRDIVVACLYVESRFMTVRALLLEHVCKKRRKLSIRHPPPPDDDDDDDDDGDGDDGDDGDNLFKQHKYEKQYAS